MNISEKVLQLKQDFDDVYAAGKAAGGGSGGDNTYHYVTNTTNVYGIFQNKAFAENTNAIVELTATGVFYFYGVFNKSTNVKTIKVISPQNPTTTVEGTNAFRESPQLEIVDLTQSNLEFNKTPYMFLGSANLKSILGTLDFSNVTRCELWLSGCTALQDISFVKETIKISISFEYCSLLTDASIQSIIDGLADLTQYYEVGDQIGVAKFEYPETEVKFEDVVSVRSSDYTMSDGVLVYVVYVLDGSMYYAYKKVSDPQTLTLHADVKAKLTDEQKTTITNKGWLLA